MTWVFHLRCVPCVVMQRPICRYVNKAEQYVLYLIFVAVFLSFAALNSFSARIFCTGSSSPLSSLVVLVSFCRWLFFFFSLLRIPNVIFSSTFFYSLFLSLTFFLSLSFSLFLSLTSSPLMLRLFLYFVAQKLFIGNVFLNYSLLINFFVYMFLVFVKTLFLIYFVKILNSEEILNLFL